jgi:hypothetical protein
MFATSTPSSDSSTSAHQVSCALTSSPCVIEHPMASTRRMPGAFSRGSGPEAMRAPAQS